jgi:hypothetical protein
MIYDLKKVVNKAASSASAKAMAGRLAEWGVK